MTETGSVYTSSSYHQPFSNQDIFLARLETAGLMDAPED